MKLMTRVFVERVKAEMLVIKIFLHVLIVSHFFIVCVYCLFIAFKLLSIAFSFVFIAFPFISQCFSVACKQAAQPIWHSIEWCWRFRARTRWKLVQVRSFYMLSILFLSFFLLFLRLSIVFFLSI